MFRDGWRETLIEVYESFATNVDNKVDACEVVKAKTEN
jgi:hypothetical protein